MSEFKSSAQSAGSMPLVRGDALRGVLRLAGARLRPVADLPFAVAMDDSLRHNRAVSVTERMPCCDPMISDTLDCHEPIAGIPVRRRQYAAGQRQRRRGFARLSDPRGGARAAGTLLAALRTAAQRARIR